MRKMNRTVVILLTLLCCCCVLRPRAQQLFPAGRHWIYSYEALVRTGALLPAEAHSQWELRGTLAVHSLDAHTAALRLADLHASAYNGPRDSASSAAVPPLEPVPTEAARYLHAPFLVHYTTDGAEALSVPVAEPLWAINVKRSIASVLQLRPELLSERASLTSERGLLGLCRDVEYSVVNNTEYVYLRKNIDGTRCELTPLSWSSAPLFSCGDGSHEGQREYAASTTREYTLARRPLEGRLELEHVMSSRRLYVQPHSAIAEAHNVYQYQAYRLLSSEAVTWPELEPPSRLVRRALTFEHDTCDLTQGRAAASADQQDALRQVHSLLDRLVSTLDASEGPAAGAPPPHSRLLTQLYYTSYRLRLDTLQRLYDDIAIGTSYQLETKRNMFLELLPQIGTAASAHFLRDLIVSHRVRPLACLKLLAVLPFYARHSDETLLRELESLLMLGDTHDLSVRRAAALSFATLVQRTRAAARCSSETHELYARRFLDLFADATDHDQRMLYLQALDNLQPVSTFTFLSSLITGEGGGGSEQYSRHLRSLALWALLPLGERHAADTYRLLWPLLVNRSEHLELRAVSLAALLAAQPSETRLLTLYWYMQAEADLHLRHFFYTTLVSLRGTTYPCYARLARVARLVVRFLRAPASPAWTTANHLLDYRDAESMFGGMAHLYLIGHPVSGAPAVLHLTVNNYAAGRSLNQVTLHLKLQGLDDRLAAHLANATTAAEPSFERLVQLLESANVKVPVADDLHIEIIVKVQGKSVFCHHFDNNNFNNMINALKHLDMFLAYHINYQSIFLAYLSEHAEPSDVGTLVLRGIVSNSVASARGNCTTGQAREEHVYGLDLDLRYYTYTTSFLEAYSPLWDTWHGVHKSRSVQARLLFNGTLAAAGATLVLRAAPQLDHVSAALHSHTQTYVLAGSGGGGERPRCAAEHAVRAAGPAPVSVEPLLSLAMPPLAVRLSAHVFDCERGQRHGGLIADVLAAHRANTASLSIAAPLLYALHALDRIAYVLPHRSCGLSLVLRPDSEPPAEVEFTLERQVVVAAKTVQMTLTHKRPSDGHTLQSWTVSADVQTAADRQHVNLCLGLRHTDVTGAVHGLCAEVELAVPCGDMLLTLQDETLLRVRASWTVPADNCSSLHVGHLPITELAIVSAPSDDSRRQWHSGEGWPFAQCRQDAGNSSIPISMACLTAARQVASSGRLYSVYLTVSDAPRWLQEAVGSLLHLAQSRGTAGQTPAPPHRLRSVINASITVSTARPILTVRLDEQQASIALPSPLFEPLLPVVVAASGECLLSDRELWTMDNRTVPLQEARKADQLLLAECSRRPRFALFLDGAAPGGELAFTLHAAGGDTVTVRPSPAAVLVTVNGAPLAGSDGRTAAGTAVRRLPADTLLLITPGLELRHTRTYMLVRHRVLLPSRVVGLCAGSPYTNK